MKWQLRVMKKDKLWYLISGLLMLVAVISLGVRGLNYSIDFRGGILMDLRFEKDVTMADLRGILNDHGLGGAVIRRAAAAEAVAGGKGKEFIITTKSIPDGERRQLFADLEQRLGRFETLSVDHVTPVIGDELKRNAGLGILLAVIGMLIYITIRFEWRFGVAAVIALIHDVLLTVGFFSVFQLPVDTSFVAAILTVFGYSINDTIIIFDRIRENLAMRRKETLGELVDRSLNQVLVRSIITSLTTVFAIGAIYVFGGRTTRDLALALMVGIGFGAYSSIFVASPLYVRLTEFLARRRARTA